MALRRVEANYVEFRAHWMTLDKLMTIGRSNKHGEAKWDNYYELARLLKLDDLAAFEVN